MEKIPLIKHLLLNHYCKNCKNYDNVKICNKKADILCVNNEIIVCEYWIEDVLTAQEIIEREG